MRKFGWDEYFCPVDFAVSEAGTVWSAESSDNYHPRILFFFEQQKIPEYTEAKTADRGHDESGVNRINLPQIILDTPGTTP